jgi:hypothetical protein
LASIVIPANGVRRQCYPLLTAQTNGILIVIPANGVRRQGFQP